MSSSKTVILRGKDGFGSFLDRLQDAHTVHENLPAVQRTKSQIDREFEEAREQGYAIGYAEGFNQGKDKGFEVGLDSGASEAKQELQDALTQALTEFCQTLGALQLETQAALQQWIVQAEPVVAKLALHVAREAVHRELQNPDTVLELVRVALLQTSDASRVRIRVNPSHVAILEGRRDELVAGLAQFHHIELVADQNVFTSCIVEADGTVIDARPDTYFDRCAEAIESTEAA